MNARTLALLCMAACAIGCTAQVHSVDDDTTGTGGQEAAGGAATGGNTNVGGTSFLDEGEVLLGSCMFSPSNSCQDFVSRPEYEQTEDHGEQICLGEHVGDTSTFVEWSGGEHCPLEGAGLVCKGNTRISYFYGEGTLTAEEAEEGCQTGDGYGVPVYFRE